MTSKIHFIADVHLPPNADAPLTRAFLQFMQTEAPQVDRLYILGDLFDGWLGDDIGLVVYRSVIDALAAFSASGKQLYIGKGNRDFLLKADFAQATGCQLLADVTEITLGEQHSLLLHGDTLCTDDVDYLTMRHLFTTEAWQADILSKSVEERMQIAQQLKAASEHNKADKSAAVMDVTQLGLDQLLADYPQSSIVIHGHTHLPQRHAPYRGMIRYVLGDWRPNAQYLHWDGQALQEKEFIAIG